MTEDQTGKISLEDVRSRFLETEERLQEAVTAIDEVRSSAQTIATTRESLIGASERLAMLSGSLADLASGLAENAGELRKGVDALRMGDPAETRRQIEELGQAFSASQAVTTERLDALDEGVSKASDAVRSEIFDGLDKARGATDRAIARNRLEARVGFLLVAAIAGAAAIVPLATTTT